MSALEVKSKGEVQFGASGEEPIHRPSGIQLEEIAQQRASYAKSVSSQEGAYTRGFDQDADRRYRGSLGIYVSVCVGHGRSAEGGCPVRDIGGGYGFRLNFFADL